MKDVKLIVGIVATVLSLMIPDGMAQAPARQDPSLPRIDNPFKGVVIVATATTLTVKGEIKPPGPRNSNPNPNGTADKAKPEHGDIHFALKGAKITRDGKPCEVRDIQRGDTATIDFTPPKLGGSKFAASKVDLISKGNSTAEEKKQ